MRLLLLALLLIPLCLGPALRAADGPDYLTGGAATWPSNPGYKVSTAAGVATLARSPRTAPAC